MTGPPYTIWIKASSMSLMPPINTVCVISELWRLFSTEAMEAEVLASLLPPFVYLNLTLDRVYVGIENEGKSGTEYSQMHTNSCSVLHKYSHDTQKSAYATNRASRRIFFPSFSGSLTLNTCSPSALFTNLNKLY